MIVVKTNDGLNHILANTQSISTYSTDPSTVALVQAAYDAGNYEVLPDLTEQLPDPDWEGFAAWRYQQPAYLSLIDERPGRVALFESSVSRGELQSAISILATVADSIPIELAQGLAVAAVEFNIPQEVIDALMGVLSGG